VFGLFSLALLVIGFFMTIGADYFGRWPFYLSLAVVLALGLLRAGRKFSQAEQLEKLRRQKSQLEQVLASAETERDRLLDLRRQVTGEAPQRES
jgi:putative Mn2+ efflux pump MntP